MDYVALYDKMVITPVAYAKAVKIATSIEAEPRYKAIEAKTGVPAILVGALHHMESERNFSKSFFNGIDGLKTRTRMGEPYGQPRHLKPPYTWEQVTIAALAYDSIKPPLDDYAQMCKQTIKFNGNGYEKRKIVSPYGFAGTNLYKRGKFVSDGKFSASVVSTQTGACVILKAHEDLIAEAPPKFNPPYDSAPVIQPPTPSPLIIKVLPLLGKAANPTVPWETHIFKDRSYRSPISTVKFSRNIKAGDITRNGSRPFPNKTLEICYRELAKRLEAVSDFYGGKRLIIESGYRPEPINRSIGGAPRSRHVGYSGCAVDLVVSGVRSSQVFKDFSSSWQGGMGGGEGSPITHFDLRDNFTSRWGYDSNGRYIN